MTSSLPSVKSAAARSSLGSVAKNPVQLPLRKFRAPSYVSPLMEVGTARGALKLNEDEVLELVEVRLALIGFNIASPGTRRRELRILAESVYAYSKVDHDLNPEYYCALTQETAIASILPRHNKPWFEGTELAALLICSSALIIDLIGSKCLEKLPGTTIHPGPGGTPLITRDSFVAFLKERFTC